MKISICLIVMHFQYDIIHSTITNWFIVGQSFSPNKKLTKSTLVCRLSSSVAVITFHVWWFDWSIFDWSLIWRRLESLECVLHSGLTTWSVPLFLAILPSRTHSLFEGINVRAWTAMSIYACDLCLFFFRIEIVHMFVSHLNLYNNCDVNELNQWWKEPYSNHTKRMQSAITSSRSLSLSFFSPLSRIHQYTNPPRSSRSLTNIFLCNEHTAREIYMEKNQLWSWREKYILPIFLVVVLFSVSQIVFVACYTNTRMRLCLCRCGLLYSHAIHSHTGTVWVYVTFTHLCICVQQNRNACFVAAARIGDTEREKVSLEALKSPERVSIRYWQRCKKIFMRVCVCVYCAGNVSGKLYLCNDHSPAPVPHYL